MYGVRPKCEEETARFRQFLKKKTELKFILRWYTQREYVRDNKKKKNSKQTQKRGQEI